MIALRLSELVCHQSMIEKNVLRSCKSFSVYIDGILIKLGGVGAADCVPEILVEKTTPDERIEIAKWTREIMPKGNELERWLSSRSSRKIVT